MEATFAHTDGNTIVLNSQRSVGGRVERLVDQGGTSSSKGSVGGLKCGRMRKRRLKRKIKRGKTKGMKEGGKRREGRVTKREEAKKKKYGRGGR